MAEGPSSVVDLDWRGDLVFDARVNDVAFALDSQSVQGPSPPQLLASALAGCMAMDVIHIVRRGRHVIRAARMRIVGRRAADEPRRFLNFEIHFQLDADVPAEQVERAIALSRDKYCSVWHSLRQDIDLRTTFSIGPIS